MRCGDFDKPFGDLAVDQRRDLRIAHQRNEVLADVASGQPEQGLRGQR